MKNIFLFIRRFFTFFVFLVLQILCISFLVKYSKTYEAAYSNVAHEMTGNIDKRYNNIQYYFDLKKSNLSLAEENARLRDALGVFVHDADSLNKNKLYILADSLNKDSLGNERKYQYFAAKVVNNSLTRDNNYITLEKGAAQGIEKSMAVAGPHGIVGQIVAVSKNYSLALSLLSHNSRVSVMLKKDSIHGLVEWDGSRANMLDMTVPKGTKVAKGDTVITSNWSSNFPEGLMVGRVISVKYDPAAGINRLRIATATDFYTLQFAYIIKNKFFNEQKSLESTATPTK